MFIKVTHANLPDTPVYVRPEAIIVAYHSTAHKCTHLVVTRGEGQGVWPVVESPDEIVAAIRALTNQSKERV